MTKVSHRAVEAVRFLWSDFRRCWSSLVAFEAAFKLLEAWFLAPVVAVALAAVMARTGRVAVNDWDILDFLLSPVGVVYLLLTGTLISAAMMFEHAAVMALAGRAGLLGEPPKVSPATVLSLAWRVIRLGWLKCGLLAISFVPFAVVVGITYVVCLSRQDINYYLAERPPTFWIAASISAVLLAGLMWVGLVLSVRWAFALPILLYERLPAAQALKESRLRTADDFWAIGVCIVGWQLGSFVVGICLNVIVGYVFNSLPDSTTNDSFVLVLLLVVRGVLTATLSFAATVGQALLVRRLYFSQLDLRDEQVTKFQNASIDSDVAVSKGSGWVLFVAVLAIVFLPIGIWTGLSSGVDTPPLVRVSAHRGHEKVAPENTLSSIRAAIEIGADYAEIDVQLTSDGYVVLLHDRDLKRVTGDPRRLDAITYADLQKLDAGRWFSPEFAGERVPALADVIDLCRGRIKLNIELKSYGPDPKLASEVARIISEKQFETDCVVTSFSHDALMDIRSHNPRVRTGLIVAAALGDVTKLEGEIVSIRMELLSDRLLRRARARGLEVHVWGVQDERQMVRQVLRGVDNIITSDPELLLSVRDRLTRLSDAERIVLASRVLLDLE